jgi:outer membrane protein, multidrug efflux system
MRSAMLMGLLALAGGACAPGYRPADVAVPTTFREMADSNRPGFVTTDAATATSPATRPATALPAPVESDYWQRLGDTTLSRLIAEAARTSRDVQAARSRVSAARSERVRAALELTPSATVSGSYARQRFSTAAFPGVGVSTVFPDQNVWDAGVSASWDLDVFGQIRQTVQARGALVGAAQAEQRDVQVTVTAELARTYFELRGAQEQLAVARQNAENQRRTYEVTKERLDAGRGSAFDTERAQAQLSSTLASIPAREAEVAAAQYRIGVLIGRSPTDVARELEQAGRIPTLPEVTSIGEPAVIVRSRPDVAAAERLAAAQGALVGAARASYLPRLTIGGTAGYAAPDFSAVGNRGTFRYAVGPVLTWPGLNLGRVKADVDAAQAREDAARAEYGRVVLAAIGDVETSLTRYRAARQQVERLTEASAASDRAAELARLRFSEGVTDFLSVLDAQRTQLEAEDRLAQGRVAAATAYAALYRAVGGSL